MSFSTTREIPAGAMYKCPFCAEEVKKEASVCKHCGKEMTPVIDSNASPAKIEINIGIFMAIGALIGAICMGRYYSDTALLAAAMGAIVGCVFGCIVGFITKFVLKMV